MGSIDDNNFNESNEKLIDELETQLDELKFISDSTKEYLFVLEREVNEKNKKIKSLQKDIKKKNKKIKELKKENKKIESENKLIKSSTSWKITSPLRKLFRLFKK